MKSSPLFRSMLSWLNDGPAERELKQCPYCDSFAIVDDFAPLIEHPKDLVCPKCIAEEMKVMQGEGEICIVTINGRDYLFTDKFEAGQFKLFWL